MKVRELMLAGLAMVALVFVVNGCGSDKLTCDDLRKAADTCGAANLSVSVTNCDAAIKKCSDSDLDKFKAFIDCFETKGKCGAGAADLTALTGCLTDSKVTEVSAGCSGGFYQGS
jgi:hypothetical protein